MPYEDGQRKYKYDYEFLYLAPDIKTFVFSSFF
jgi:hypothetical protein